MHLCVLAYAQVTECIAAIELLLTELVCAYLSIFYSFFVSGRGEGTWEIKKINDKRGGLGLCVASPPPLPPFPQKPDYFDARKGN